MYESVKKLRIIQFYCSRREKGRGKKERNFLSKREFRISVFIQIEFFANNLIGESFAASQQTCVILQDKHRRLFELTPVRRKIFLFHIYTTIEIEN